MPLTTWKRRAEGVRMAGETYVNLDLRSMKAFGSEWKDCNFEDCRFDLADLRSSKFLDCRFVDCSMPLVNFGVSFFERTTFRGCNLEQSSFQGCHLTDLSFLDCRMAYAETLFQDATVRVKLELSGCNLHGSNLDFREVSPHALTIEGCNVWGAKLAFGCAAFNGKIDERTKMQFLALIARVSEDETVKKLAGDQWDVVDRLMKDQK